MVKSIKKYVSQPLLPGMYSKHRYEVAKYCEEEKNYISLPGELFRTKEEAEQRAYELNNK